MLEFHKEFKLVYKIIRTAKAVSFC